MFPRGDLENMHHLHICPNPRVRTMGGLTCGAIQSRERERERERERYDVAAARPPIQARRKGAFSSKASMHDTAQAKIS